MATQDSMELLRQCDAGVKMASASLDDVLERIEDQKLRRLLTDSRRQHELVGRQVRALLEKFGESEKEPNPLARGMSAVKTGVKLGLDESDETVADLITEGCSMGIKSLHRYLNQYQAADPVARALCRTLVAIEEQLVADIRPYL